MDVGIKTLRTIRYLKFRQILWRLIYFFAAESDLQQNDFPG